MTRVRLVLLSLSFHSYVQAQSIEPGNLKLKGRVRNARKQVAVNMETKHEIDLYDSASIAEDDAAIKIQVRSQAVALTHPGLLLHVS